MRCAGTTTQAQAYQFVDATAAPGPLTVVGGAGAQFTVLDQLGRPVQRARLSRDQPQLDVRSLPSGQYFLQDGATGQRTRFAKAD